MDNKLPKRKDLRLKNYDYSSQGAYFVTICSQNKEQIFSTIDYSVFDKYEILYSQIVGDGAFDVPQPTLTQIGRIVEKYLLSSENISGVTIDEYIIMPNHIHFVVFLDPEKYRRGAYGTLKAPSHTDENVGIENGTSKAPSPANEMLPHMVSTFKRFVNKEIGENIFQRSYIEHVIRDVDDYNTKRKYIYENPLRWYFKSKGMR